MIENCPKGQVTGIDIGIHVRTDKELDQALNVSFGLYDLYYSPSSGCGDKVRDIQFTVPKDQVQEIIQNIRTKVEAAGLKIDYLDESEL